KPAFARERNCSFADCAWNRARRRDSGSNLLHIADEAITVPADSFDVTRVLSGITQGGSQFIDRAADVVVEINEGAIRPQPLAELLAGDNFAGALEQSKQQLERAFLKHDAAAQLAQLTRLQV